MPVEIALGKWFALERGSEVDAIELLRAGRFGEGKEGGVEIDLMNGGVVGTAGFDDAGELGEEGFTDAAFVVHPFHASKRSGAGDVTVGAVVGGEDDEGVVAEILLLEGFENLADGEIHGFDHRGILWIVMGFGFWPFTVFFSEVVAGLDGSVDGVKREVDEKGGFFVIGNPVGNVAA